MLRMPDDYSPEERRAHRKWAGGVLVFYGSLMILGAGIMVGNQLCGTTRLTTQPWQGRVAKSCSLLSALRDL